MKTWKRTLALLLSLALAASLCACGSISFDPANGSANPSPSASQDPGAVPSIEVDLTQDALKFAAGLSGDDVLLTVDGEDVNAELFLYWLFWDCYYFEYYYYYYGITVADFADMLLEDAVDMALYYILLHRRAVELGCVLTDEQRAELESYKTGENEETYEQYRAAFGLSVESMDFIDALDYYYDNLLNALPMPTEDELNGYVYQVKHILLMTIDDSGEALPDDEIAAQRALAEDILAQLQAVEGEERQSLFDELMNQYSEDGRDENGDLYAPDGYTSVPGEMVTEFEEASLALPIGGLSGIVESTYGFHIILRGEVDSIEDYADDCRAYQLDQELDALADAAEVTRAAALESLDVADFYERYFAYQSAVMEQHEATGGDTEG